MGILGPHMSDLICVVGVGDQNASQSLKFWFLCIMVTIMEFSLDPFLLSPLGFTKPGLIKLTGPLLNSGLD